MIDTYCMQSFGTRRHSLPKPEPLEARRFRELSLSEIQKLLAERLEKARRQHRASADEAKRLASEVAAMEKMLTK